ncbi:MAG: metallophosphoesterase [Thermotogota bacterium]
MKKLKLLSIFLLIAVFSFTSNNTLRKGYSENSGNLFVQNNQVTLVLNEETGTIESLYSNAKKISFLSEHKIIIQNHEKNDISIEPIELGYKVKEKSDNYEVVSNYIIEGNTLKLITKIKNISDKSQLLKMNELLSYDGVPHDYISKSFLNKNLFSIQIENAAMIYGSYEEKIGRMFTNGNRIFSSPKFQKLKPGDIFSFNRSFETGKNIALLHKSYMDKKNINYKTYSGKIDIEGANDLEYINLSLKEKFFEDILTKTYTDKDGNYEFYYPEKENLYIELDNDNFSKKQYFNLSTNIKLKSQNNDFFYLPALTNVKPDGITFNFRTSIPSKSIIHIFKNGEKISEIKNNYPKEYHQSEIRGLQPDTKYYYYIELPESYGSERNLSLIRQFRTAPDEFKPFNFVVYGDTQIHNERHELVVDTIYKNHGYPSFIARVGDQVEKGHDESMWAEHFEASYKLNGSVPVYTTLGNHEYNDVLYYKALDLPNGGGEDNERYYSMDYLNIHFIFLDSNITETNPEFETQLEWLENDLKNIDKEKFIFVSFHHPFWTQAQEYGEMEENKPEGHYNTKHWLPLFKKYGVDAVFNGHIHSYERHYKDGIHFITTAGGGSKLNELHTAEPLPWKEFELLRHLNYVNVEILQEKTIFTVYSVAYAPSKDTPEIYTPTNEIIESFEINK